jgi:ribosome-associated protein
LTSRLSPTSTQRRPEGPDALYGRRYTVAMQSMIFHLDRGHVALNDLLKLTGVAGSGGEGKALVASGAVAVDGVVEMRKTAKIRGGQRVRVGDFEIVVQDDAARRA